MPDRPLVETDVLPKVALFDFDGTLIDSFPAITSSVNHVRALHGLPELTVPEVTRHVGRGPVYLLTHTVEKGDVQANVDAYRAHHPSVFRHLTTLLPGARRTLEVLRARGVKLGVCSNKPVDFSRELVQHLQFSQLLDVVLGPEDVGRHKPAPDMLQAALARLGESPQDALYVGDMVVDVETARAAGVRVWVVATGSDTREALERARPDRLMSSLEEMLAWLG